jgi:hypothetical protein
VEKEVSWMPHAPVGAKKGIKQIIDNYTRSQFSTVCHGFLLMEERSPYVDSREDLPSNEIRMAHKA